MMDRRVLMIVDDDQLNRLVFLEAVKKLGIAYEFREAEHGEDAIFKLRAGDLLPDYIFLDLQMPLMDGNEFLAELKKDERLRHIPVIIYSTSTYKDEIEHTLSLGAIASLTKTADVMNLPDKIKFVLELTKAA